VRQVCEGGFRRPGVRREIVRSETSNPSFNNSPCIRGAPERVRDGHLPDQASNVGADVRPDASGVSSTTRSRGDATRQQWRGARSPGPISSPAMPIAVPSKTTGPTTNGGLRRVRP
jgi:hypothetical protein